MIVLQALAVGAMGFSIGSGLCAAFHAIMLHYMTTRGMVLLWQTVLGTGAAIFLVIIIASLISIRRVLVLEPAAVFRG
jgi:putative ABC transport system permease protein